MTGRPAPPLTVVMPTYERADLLAEALRSALDQSWGDLEVLIGDNSTSDATEELVASIDDDRVRYHRNRPGLGPIENWLDLVERARSPLIATLHDDDRWLPGFLDALVPPMLDDSSIALSFCDFWLIDGDGHRLVEYTESESTRTHRDRLPGGRLDLDPDSRVRLVAVWNAPQPLYAAVTRRDALRSYRFDPDSLCPDIWFSYHLASGRAGLRYEPRRLTEYRVHPGAITSSGLHDSEDAFFSRVVADTAGRPVRAEVERYWATLRWSRATRLLRRHDGATPDRAASQAEFLAAAPALGGPRRLVAEVAGRSDLAWRGMSAARDLRLRYRPRAADVRYA